MKSNIIGKLTLSTQFDWHTDTKTACTMASDLDPTGQVFLGPLYNDACDQGFVIESSRTQKKEPCYLSSIVKQEGDVLYWEFKFTNPELKNWKVIVFND